MDSWFSPAPCLEQAHQKIRVACIPGNAAWDFPNSLSLENTRLLSLEKRYGIPWKEGKQERKRAKTKKGNSKKKRKWLINKRCSTLPLTREIQIKTMSYHLGENVIKLRFKKCKIRHGEVCSRQHCLQRQNSGNNPTGTLTRKQTTNKEKQKKKILNFLFKIINKNKNQKKENRWINSGILVQWTTTQQRK